MVLATIVFKGRLATAGPPLRQGFTSEPRSTA
jgi:hypothetical protein